jgi:serine/threonine protein kinase
MSQSVSDSTSKVDSTGRDDWVRRVLNFDVTSARQSATVITPYTPGTNTSWSSTSDTDSTDGSGNGSSGPQRPDSPLPDGVDLSGAHMGRSIKSGSFGSVSWLNGAKGTPPLVIKVPTQESARKDLEHEAEFFEKVGPHANIVTCLGMQTVDGKQGLVLEGINGGDMRKAMKQLETLSNADPNTAKQHGMDRALSHAEHMGTMQYMLRETLKGLAHLEEKGVVHTDIRPDNVMCDSETGQVKIIDFGLAHESGLPTQGRTMPIGHGMVAPEQATMGMTVNSNADVFATGELMRQTMEGHEFRYNKGDFSRPGYNDAQEFLAGDKRSLNPMPEAWEPDKDDSPSERLDDMRRHIEALLEDPVAQKNPAVGQLGNEIRRASNDIANLDDDELNELEERVGVVSRSVKTSGNYRAITSYTEFVNWAMHPDPSQRPSAKEALEHPFLQDSLLDDEQAREVLKRVLTGSQQPQTIPLDSDSGSSTGMSSTSTDSSLDSLGSNTGSMDEFITRKVGTYLEFLMSDGTWSGNSEGAVKRPKGGQPPQPSGDSTSSTGSNMSTDSVLDSLGSNTGSLDGDDGEFVTRTDSNGYMEFLTAEGTWSRNRSDAAKHPKGGQQPEPPGDGKASLSDPSYDDLSKEVEESKTGTQDAPPPPPEAGAPPPPPPLQENTGGWTRGTRPDGTGRRGPTVGRGRGSETGSEDTPPPPDEGKSGWTRGTRPDGTGRDGPTIGRGRGGTAPEGTPPETEEKPEGWTGTRPRSGAGRSGPTIGRGRGGS